MCRVFRARILALGVLLVLGACMRTAPPAPVVSGAAGQHRGGASRASAATEMVSSGPDRVVVQPGETLFAIARRTNVPVRSLIETNGLQPPFALVAGRTLTIPRVRQHLVQPGETLYSVSRQFGVDATALARMNNLQAPSYTIKVGLPLLLPAPVEAAPVTAIAAVPAAGEDAPPVATGGSVISSTPLPPPVPPALPAERRPVPAAQSQPETSPAAPASLPAAPAPVSVPEQPRAAAAPPAPPPPAPPPPASSAPVAPASVAPAPVAPVPEAPPPQEAVVRPDQPPAVGEHRAPSAPIFFWPVRGRVVSGFGGGAGGTQNDGINIAAPAGTPVSAADSGTVAYAGNELRGFGNLVLIKHADGWVSAYAHNQTLLVKKGDKVRRGQPIAQVGATGSVGDPQLHFELRRGTRALDPLDHLPQLSAGES
jgi:murein DD-endopeptidase MepM/ murein hydrolase activator NlpD